MVFIDGDHSYKAVKQDIQTAINLLKPGGMLSGHDYNKDHWPGTVEAVNELLPEVNEVDTIWWTRKF